MSGRFASLHAGLLLRERPRAAPPPSVDAPPQSAVVRPFPGVTAPYHAPAPKELAPEQMAAKQMAPKEMTSSMRRRAFTVRLDEAQHALLQLAKLRFGLSGQRLLLMALERLVGVGGR
jgi:hypothetical protein